MNYAINEAVLAEDEKRRKRIRTMVKIGAMEFAFTSNFVDYSSSEKYLNFGCNDSLLSGACKVLGINEEKLTDDIKKAALPLFNLAVSTMGETRKLEKLNVWKNLDFWEFIKDFKTKIPADCTVSHITYERGVEMINDGGMSRMDSFPTISITTPYNQREIQVEERQAYTGDTYRSRPSYTYYDVTCGYDEKFGKPRKIANIIKTVLKAIETLKVRDEHQKAALKYEQDKKKAVLSELGYAFIAEDERKYSPNNHRGKTRSWVETKYKSDFLSARKVRESEYKVVVIPTLNAEKVNKLNEFLKTL